jgi:5-methylcytosine-specific restriction protein A
VSPFEIGRKYERRELLDFVGSKQQQTGIIWGARQPGCVICTSGGRHSKRVGYEDGPSGDGIWSYVGQGGAGDQSESAFANKMLIDGTRSVLLFLTREATAAEARKQGNYSKRYEYAGAFHVAGYEIVAPETGPRLGDRLIKFSLAPAIDDPESLAVDLATATADLSSLRKAAIGASKVPETRQSLATYRERSLAVRKYALARARGSCEWCKNKAPFVDRNGNPFLEVHHILRLADDGPDLPANVVAVCPNCHRAAHFSEDMLAFRDALAARAREIEDLVERKLG